MRRLKSLSVYFHDGGALCSVMKVARLSAVCLTCSLSHSCVLFFSFSSWVIAEMSSLSLRFTRSTFSASLQQQGANLALQDYCVRLVPPRARTEAYVVRE